MVSQDPDTYTIQVWADASDCEDSTIRTVMERGFRMIVSNSDATYLDCGYAGWVTDGNNWCSPYKGWQVITSLTRRSISGSDSLLRDL